MNAILSARPPVAQSESSLALGNLALRAGDFPAAIGCYLPALQTTPALAKIITGNLAMARHKYRAGRVAEERHCVAVCGWNLAHDPAGRVHTLAKLYETFADVEIIGSIFSGVSTETSESIRNTTIACHTFVIEDESRFIEQPSIQVDAQHSDVRLFSQAPVS